MKENSVGDDNRITNMIDRADDLSQKGSISYLVKEWGKKVSDINRKYSKPRLKMTPWVRASLIGLRLYLIMLVIILCYKFYTLVK
jgi:hypothetical protein